MLFLPFVGGIELSEEKVSADMKLKSFFVGKHLISSVLIILIVGTFFGFYGFNQIETTGKVVIPVVKNNVDSGLPVELFVMSQCPYGTQAEDVVMPVIESFGDKVNFNIHFIASESGSGFSSLHGQPEVNEDIRQTCIQEKYSREVFFDYLDCANKNISDIENQWKTCAENTGINVKEIESCYTSEEGKNLFKENFKKTSELMIGSSPTYYINNEIYSGGRTAQDITRAICSFVDAEPCTALPEETEVNLFVVNDLDCKECDSDTISAQLKGFFLKLKVTKVDYLSEEGKAVLEKFQAETVPFFYFDSTITKHYNWESFKLYTTENGELYSLNYSGVKYFNLTEKPNHVDLFVMSQCPYGTIAEGYLKEAAEALPDMTYNIYFIAGETEDGFSSLHGQVEVNEDMRQTCIARDYQDKLLDYISCVNEDILNVEGNWKACAIKNEIDVDSIESCYTSEEGTELFRNNIETGNTLKIGSSPTYLFNGQIMFRPSSAEGIKQVVCSYNELEGCDTTLTGTTNNTLTGSC